VQRCAILISLSGFKASMVPYVCECIQILRKHYPGRLGVACLYNTPPYWYPFWRIFCGLFDEEIMSKVGAALPCLLCLNRPPPHIFLVPLLAHLLRALR
jgi:hypothetical protein